MVCYHPLTAFYSKEVGSSGKRGVTFDRNASFSGLPLKLPCGQCHGCRLEKSRQWAVRCMHENQMHVNSGFITRTYDPKHLPAYGSLVKRDFQLFMKRLRKKHGKGIRFFACGEYGTRFKRPHYHAILFGLQLSDRKFVKNSDAGDPLYTSANLRELWSYGNNIVGDVTFNSCAYVARYVCDKITGDRADDHYSRVLADGEIIRLQPEFSLMSRKPGIGFRWYEKYGEHSYKWDAVVMNGREIRPPRFYDVKREITSLDEMALLKRKRRRKAIKYRLNNTRERLRIRETVALKKAALFKRGIE